MKKKVKIVGFFEALSYLMLLGTLMTFFARFFWMFELSSHFRVHYLIAFCIPLAIFGYLKKWRPCVIFAIAFLWNAWYVFPDFIASPKVSQPQTSSLKLMTYNVYYGNRNYNQVIKFIENSGCDFILMQEITFSWEKELTKLKKTYPYQKGLSRNDSFGIWLLSRKPFLKNEITNFGVYDGVPNIKVQIEHENTTFILINTHPLPPVSESMSKRRNEQLVLLAKNIQKISEPIVVAGDFNVSPWSPYFSDFMANSQLKDSRKGYGIHMTWPAVNYLFLVPIDHCFVSQNIQIHNRTVEQNHGSDHFPVVVEFSLPLIGD